MAPGVDSEAIDVVRDCLEDVFKLDSSSCEKICPGLLMDLFTSEEIGQHQLRSYLDSAAAGDTSHATLHSPEAAEDSEMLEASKVCFFFRSHNFVSVDVYAIVLCFCGFLFMVCVL